MDEATDETTTGAARRRRAQGRRHDSLQASLTEIDPQLAAWSDGFVFGEVWAGEDLSWDDRMLVAIIVLSALGHHAQLRNYLHGALQDGFPQERLRQAMSMLTVYAGFPVAIQALSVLQQVVETEARHRGASEPANPPKGTEPR
jgi:alkylhydroperoxidase/carboxymuconolactone decarboxylase family protein YurZ